jgi:subtilisin family serine protease
VSGVAALVRAKYPKLTPAQVRTALERSASRPSGAYGEDLGWGVVQAAGALRLAATMTAEPVAPGPVTTTRRTLGRGGAPAVGLRAFDGRRLVTALALLPLGGAFLSGAALLAVRRRRSVPATAPAE